MSQNYFLFFLKQHWLSRCTYHTCRLQATRINSTGLIFISVDVGALLSALVESKFLQWIAAKVSFPQVDKYHWDLNEQHIQRYYCHCTILSLYFEHNQQNLIPGTKNEISERIEGVTGNGGICFKTEQKKCA